MKTESKTKSSANRPPIVVVMGHIDHGKSTLLDFIRKTKVVEKEAGGITQHLGAYEVEIEANGKKHKMTFLDTPGHEAFKAIRSRGAKVADIAILVVAADDSVKPQTLEAIKCIKEENIPFIVAINKIDKPEANPEKAKNDLAEAGIFLEGFGGDVPNVSISAKTGKNIEELLELIGLMAEMENLNGDPEAMAEGVVLESNMDSKKGILATLVITNGTLERGGFVATKKAIAPVRIMENFSGQNTDKETFSSPVRIFGWNQMPEVGEIFKSFKTKKEAESYISESKNYEEKSDTKIISSSEKEKIVVPVIIKADTAGGLEAVQHELKKLDNEKIEFKIVSAEIGTITESDVKKAGSGSSKAIIIGFHSKIDSSAKNLSERDAIIIKDFQIIYKMTEWLKTELSEYLPKVQVEEILGKAKILKVFGEQKGKQIIGGKVLEGEISGDGLFRILRRENNIGSGKIKELQQKKERVGKVEAGNEFGVLIESKMEIAAGDILEFYKITSQPVKI